MSKVNYKLAFPSLDKFEGGLVYIKSEGQWTNKGIQFNTYNDLCYDLLGIAPNMEHFKTMSRDQWGLFVQHFWNIATFNNSIKNPDAAIVMFTAFWSSGYVGIKEIQKGLNFTYKRNLSVDGLVGKNTVNVINFFDGSAKTIFHYLHTYWNYLASLPAYQAFKKGWNNRLNFIQPGTMRNGVSGFFLSCWFS